MTEALRVHLSESRLSLAEKYQLIEDHVPKLSQGEVEELVDALKHAADTLRLNGQTDAAFAHGQVIIRIGEVRGWYTYQGLGWMVCGDAYNHDHHYEHAWDALEKAGAFHQHAQSAGEPFADFNWARTLIGNWMCVQGKANIARVTAESETAEAIFERSTHPDAVEKRLKLYNSIGIYLYEQVEYESALRYYENIFKTLEETHASFPDIESIALLNVGNIRIYQGRARHAEANYRKSIVISEQLGFHDNVVTGKLGIANSLIQRGLYRDALRLLDEVLSGSGIRQGAWVFAMREKIQCLLELALFRDVEVEARRMLSSGAIEAHDTKWRVLTFLGMAQAEQGKLTKARETIEQARSAAQAHDLLRQEMLTSLFEAQILLRQGDYPGAQQAAEKARAHLEAIGHHTAADAHLILAETELRTQGDVAAVHAHCENALRIGMTKASPPLLYRAFLLSGHAEHAGGKPDRAESYYLNAVEAIDEAQRDLTIAYRPGFLSDKGEALSALINLYLGQGRNRDAFDMLERARAQTFNGYLARNGAHRWGNDPASQELQRELDHVRQDLMARSTAEEGCPPSEETKALQERLRQILRALYTLAEGAGRSLTSPTVDDVQGWLPPEAAVIAYFDDGKVVRALVLHRDGPPDAVECAPSASVRAAQRDLTQAVSFALGALRLVRRTNAECDAEAILREPPLNHPTHVRTFQGAAHALYSHLIQPLLEKLKGCKRLYIMPHRMLHLVPFHLLYDGHSYLIHEAEVVILPSAQRPNPREGAYPPGALTIYDNRNGTLRCSEHDALAVNDILKGQCMPADPDTVLAHLQNGSGQIIHLIAHAKFEQDSPETAFIQFGDRQFYLSDVMQHELRFRLVTLTACETGRVGLTEHGWRVAHGDDLIGIGRAFLYAGAQAILSSQWLLGDGLTLPLLTRFYQAVKDGARISQAFQRAQMQLLADFPTLHPVYWGAFQLVGNAEPLE